MQAQAEQDRQLWQLVEKLQADQLRVDQKLSSQHDQMSSQQEQLSLATAERQELQRSLQLVKTAAVTARQVRN